MYAYSNQQKLFDDAYQSLSHQIIQHQIDSISVIESYSESVWPADNLACIASLDSSFYYIKEEWLELLINMSQNESGLINHDNFDKSVVRGSSQALILYFLIEIEENFARSSYHRYNDIFIDRFFGLLLVNEYENDGSEDLDSGPLVLGYGSVATIMNVITQAQYNKQEKLTWGFLNVLGIPINIFGKKYYLFKQELMLDIFMLWTSVALI